MAAPEDNNQPAAFAELGLDPRLLRALEKRDYVKPTPVQVCDSITMGDHDFGVYWLL